MNMRIVPTLLPVIAIATASTLYASEHVPAHTTIYGQQYGVAESFRDGTVWRPWFHESIERTLAGGGPMPAWTLTTSNVTMSPPRLVDVDGDDVQDIVLATMGPIGDPYSSSSIYVLDNTGEIKSGWPVVLGNLLPITSAAIAVGDIDNNGDIELVAQGWFNMYVWNHDGTNFPGWPKATGTSFTASPALADLDGDGDLEIIAPIASNMHVWHHDGTEADGWPNSAEENFQAPAVGDVDGDGQLEVVAGTWRAPFPDAVPFQLFMWKANGDSATGFPINDLGSVRGPVALGDIDQDGDVEIVARAGDTLQVFGPDGASEPGWPVVPGGPIRNATPSIGDIDGDGDLEILIGGFDVYAYHHTGAAVAGWPVNVGASANINSSAIVASVDAAADTVEVVVKIDDAVVALHADGSAVDGFPYALSDDGQSATFSPTPAVGDVDDDGDVEYAFVSVSGTLAFFDEPHPHGPAAAYWPMFEHDVYNSCFRGETCLGDVDSSGDVGISDLLELLAAWGTDPGGPPDFDGSGDVGIDDLLTLLAAWGPC